VDADKWSDFYDRTKRENGMKPAMADLASGFVRELKSRARRAPRYREAEDILQEVDEMWREVAADHRELSPDGFKRYVQKISDDLGDLFE
jgi:hypothetical protein